MTGLPVIALPGGLLVHRAGTWATRRDGLAGLPDLPARSALWIAPCRSVHTIGMHFALDLVWLDGDESVLCVDESVGPRRQRTRLRARSVIETVAGQGPAFAGAWPVREGVRAP